MPARVAATAFRSAHTALRGIMGRCSRRWWRAIDTRPFDLQRHFSVASFVVIAVATSVLAIGYHAKQKELLARLAEDRNDALAVTLAKSVWSTHARFLVDAAALGPQALRAHPEILELDDYFRRLTADIPVLKVKIFDHLGLTLYSPEFEQIGSPSEHIDELRSAIAAAKPVTAVTTKARMQSLKGPLSDIVVANTYVPLMDGRGQVETVFEIYADVTAQTVAIRRQGIEAAAAIGASALVIYLALMLIVRHAARVLAAQREQLVSLNSELAVSRSEADALNVELECLVEQLKSSNRDLANFAHVAAHDLQEPLRKIETFGSRIAAMHGEALPADGRVYLERMLQASKRMRTLIGDLLSYARFDVAARGFSPVSLKDIVCGAVHDLQIRIEETDAVITIAELPVIEAEPTQMRQLLQNLIGNALKFQRPGVRPMIDIAARIADGAATIEVTDNGIGFDASYRDVIFDVFRRLHSRNDYDGSGVGLATCRRICDFHGGSITADGRPGEGATITVTLPVVQDKVPVRRAAA